MNETASHALVDDLKAYRRFSDARARQGFPGSLWSVSRAKIHRDGRTDEGGLGHLLAVRRIARPDLDAEFVSFW